MLDKEKALNSRKRDRLDTVIVFCLLFFVYSVFLLISVFTFVGRSHDRFFFITTVIKQLNHKTTPNLLETPKYEYRVLLTLRKEQM